MSNRDFYDILGVDRGVDAATLKSAYRKLAMKHHPDQNQDDPNAEAKFKEIAEAYAVLSDPEKRAAYDRFGQEGLNGGAGGGGFQSGFSMDDLERMMRTEFGDAFSRIFGMGMGGGRSRETDLQYDLEIDLEDAFTGKTLEIVIPIAEICDRCDGRGAEPGTDVETCPMCNGQGRVRTSQGFFTTVQTCPQCGGQGMYVKTPCVKCDGAGRVRVKKSLAIKIPAGIVDGTRIRLRGEGDANPYTGQKGDLHIAVAVRPHDLFERDSANLYCRAPVPMSTAALGGEVELPTIEGGRVKVRIPEGAQTGRQVRLRGKGMTRLRSAARGDMFVELFIETPTRLSARQRELLEAFAKESGEDCHPEHKSFFDRAKRFWDDISGTSGEGPRNS